MTTNIKSLLSHITDECTSVDVDAQYSDMLDECFSFESVGGIFASMLPSRVLKEIDPVAYRCGMNDWLDGAGYVEIDGNYYGSDDVNDARESFIATLDNEELEEEANNYSF